MTETTHEALVVTDDAQLRDEVRVNLEEEGFAVAAPATAGDALQLLGSRSPLPWLLIVDFTTPGVEAAGLAGQLRAGDLLLTLPVLITTAGKQPLDIETVYDCARLFRDEGGAAAADRGQAHRAVWRRLAEGTAHGETDRTAVSLRRRSRDDTPRG